MFHWPRAIYGFGMDDGQRYQGFSIYKAVREARGRRHRELESGVEKRMISVHVIRFETCGTQFDTRRDDGGYVRLVLVLAYG